jgi:hypothetical protein
MNNRKHNDQRAITVHIEELILHGFPAQDRDQIARSVESELTRLLRQGEIPSSLPHGGVIREIDGGTFQIQRGAKPQAIGEQISRNLYGGLKR